MPATADNIRRRQSLARLVASNAPRMEPFERRTLFAIVPTGYEQYVLELINRARSNPTAEAARLGVSLNEGLAANTISTDAKQPLAMNYTLIQSIRYHLQWLQQNSKFQHEGSGGSTPEQRMIAAGYSFGSGAHGDAENLALSLESTLGDITTHVTTLYDQLFTDTSEAGRGHRLNLLDPDMKEVGTGYASGDYTYNGSTWTGILIGQDFAYVGGNPFLTGVAYDDKLIPDNFYSPGEGVSGVTITATGSGTGHVYTTTTNISGGYQLQVPADTYTITATRSDKSHVVTYSNVVVGNQNVKRDFTGAQFDTLPAVNFATLTSKGVLGINGTSGADTLVLSKSGSNVLVTLNGTSLTFLASKVKSIQIDAGDGDDVVSIDSGVMAATIHGDDGNDTLAGGDGNDQLYGDDGDDRLSGNAGNDSLWGGAGDDNLNGNGGKNTLNGDDGNDRLNGSNGPDKLYGGSGDDRLYGNGGDDQLDGGGNNDRLYGGDGNDTLLGGNGKDRLYGEAGNDDLTGGKDADVIDGGAGKNTLRDRASIDSVLNV